MVKTAEEKGVRGEEVGGGKEEKEGGKLRKVYEKERFLLVVVQPRTQSEIKNCLRNL